MSVGRHENQCTTARDGQLFNAPHRVSLGVVIVRIPKLNTHLQTVNLLFPPLLSALNSTCGAELPAGEPQHWKTTSTGTKTIDTFRHTQTPQKHRIHSITPLSSYKYKHICKQRV